MTIEASAAPITEAGTPPPVAGSAEGAAVAAEEPKEVVTQPDEIVPQPSAGAKHFAALAKKEKALRQREEQFKKEREEFENTRKNTQSNPSKDEIMQEMKRQAKADPVGFMHEHGLTYQELTEIMLSGKAPKPVEVDPIDAKLSPVLQELQKVKQEADQLKAQLAERTQKEQQEIAEQGERAIREGIVAAAANYEWVNMFGDQGLETVREVMQNVFEQEQKVLTFDEACSMVNEYYATEFAPRLKESKVIKSWFEAPAVKSETKPESKPDKKEESTLTGDLTTASEVKPDLSKMTKEERINYMAKQYTNKRKK